MKIKILFLILIATFLYGGTDDYVCTSEQYKDALGNQARWIEGTDSFIFEDSVMKKSKNIIQVWEIQLATPSFREDAIKDFGSKYADFGYKKTLELYDIANKKTSLLAIINYTCDGKSLDSANFDSEGRKPEWRHIIPKSVGENTFKLLKASYGKK